MNSKTAQEYNYFSLLANLEKNKLHKALFTLVQHSSSLPTWALSLSPPSLLRSQKPLLPPQSDRWNPCSWTQLEERRNQSILLWVEHLVWSGLLCCLFERCTRKLVKLILISLLFRVDDNMKYTLLMLVVFFFYFHRLKHPRQSLWDGLVFLASSSSICAVVFSLLIFFGDWKASFYDFVLSSSYFFILLGMWHFSLSEK
jgi:hypothetical protein